MKTVIEIQDMMIAKMARARSFKTCSMLWANARKQATAQLIDLGFSDHEARLLVDDAEDIERLNFSCVDPIHIHHRAAVAREMAGRVRSEGENCPTCTNCPAKRPEASRQLAIQLEGLKDASK